MRICYCLLQVLCFSSPACDSFWLSVSPSVRPSVGLSHHKHVKTSSERLMPRVRPCLRLLNCPFPGGIWKLTGKKKRLYSRIVKELYFDLCVEMICFSFCTHAFSFFSLYFNHSYNTLQLFGESRLLTIKLRESTHM